MLTKLKQLLRPPAAAPGTVGWIECADLAARLGGVTTAIVDVRGADEFDGPLGHVRGAVNIPVDAIIAGAADLAGLRDRDVVLVCRTDKRSARAADSLRSTGLSRLSVLRGGMENWNALGLPVVRDHLVSK